MRLFVLGTMDEYPFWVRADSCYIVLNLGTSECGTRSGAEIYACYNSNPEAFVNLQSNANRLIAIGNQQAGLVYKGAPTGIVKNAVFGIEALSSVWVPERCQLTTKVSIFSDTRSAVLSLVATGAMDSVDYMTASEYVNVTVGKISRAYSRCEVGLNVTEPHSAYIEAVPSAISGHLFVLANVMYCSTRFRVLIDFPPKASARTYLL